MAQALSPANIAKGIEAARNPPTQEEIDAAVAALTPERRAVYEQQQQAYEQALVHEDETRVLRGPAGRALHGRGVEQLADPAQRAQQAAERAQRP